MRLLLLFATLLLSVAVPRVAVAQWVDGYGNSLDSYRSYYIPHGSAGYRQPNGQLAYPPILPKSQEAWSRSAPTYQPAPQSPPRQDRHEMLRETTPGRDYQSNSLFRDRVTPQRE